MTSEDAPTNLDDLTFDAAGKLLRVSPVHLNKLVLAGELGEVRTSAGGDRCLSNAVVLQYKAASKVRQAEGLAAMVEASNEMGLYDSELEGIPVRTKR